MTIPIPENFKTIYLKAKMENNSDIELAAQFYVDPKTLIKWKKQTGIKKEDYEKQRKPRLMPDDFKQLYIADKEKGLLDEEIAKQYFISIYTLNRWKRVVGFKPRQFANMAGLKNYKG
jgi:uncharacterized protein YjcR